MNTGTDFGDTDNVLGVYIKEGEKNLDSLQKALAAHQNAKQTPPNPGPTIGDEFNIRIAEVKQRLENLCIAKAKADTLGFLDMPSRDLQKILGHVI